MLEATAGWKSFSADCRLVCLLDPVVAQSSLASYDVLGQLAWLKILWTKVTVFQNLVSCVSVIASWSYLGNLLTVRMQ